MKRLVSALAGLLVATGVMGARAACVPAPNGLVAWWRGESNTVDRVGFHVGQYLPVTDSSSYTTGKVGAAFRFESGRYVLVPATSSLNLGLGEGLTIEGWIRPSSYQPGPVAEWNDGGRISGAGLAIHSGGPGVLEARLMATNLIPYRQIILRSAFLTVSNLVWQHIALTFDKASGMTTLYHNGLLVAQTNLAAFVPATIGNFYLGNSPAGSRSGYYSGALDELSLYDRALTAAEIQAIVLAGAEGKCLQPPTPPPTPCVAASAEIVGWWRGESNTLDSVSFNHGVMWPTNLTAALRYAPGLFGSSFSLRSGNYVVIPASEELDVGKGQGLTVEAWVNPYYSSIPIAEWSNPTSTQGNSTQGVYLAYSATLGPGYLEANLMDTQGQSHLIRSPFITPVYNQWRHVAVTYDQATGATALFVNGSPVTQTNLGVFTPRTSGNLYLGLRPPGNYPGSGARFNGWMDEVTLYRRALTAEELQCVYLGGDAGKYQPPPCVVASADVAGWWRGESNTLDSVAMNHGVTFPPNLPSVLGYSNGMYGAGFAFRANNHVVISATPGLDVGASWGLTVEAWVNPLGNSIPIVEWNSGTGTQGVSLAYSATLGPGFLEANLVDAQGGSHLVRSPFIPPVNNLWRHVAATYDRASGHAILFVNGSPVTQTNLGSFTPRTTGNLYLGYRPPGNYPGSGARFNGLMDEVTVYRRALTLAELRCVYLAGAAGKYPEGLSCVPPADGIVGWWRGEFNTLDSVADNSGGVTTSPQPDYTNGWVGSAFATRSGRFVLVPQPNGLNVGAGAGFTVEAWINPSPSVSSPATIMSWAGSPSPPGVALEYNSSAGQGNLRAILVDASGLSRWVTSPSGVIRTGQWQHVALSCDRSSGWATLFVNGAPVTATNLGSLPLRTTGNFYIGSRAGGPFFTGAIDEVAVHERALQPVELHAIYSSLNGRCRVAPMIVTQPEGLRVNQGGSAMFRVVAGGNPFLRYQWYHGVTPLTAPLSGATNATLLLPNAQPVQTGIYWVRVTNAFGVVNSTSVWLRVNLPPVADATATKTPVIAGNLTNAVVVLDATRSSDPDNDPLTYLWCWAGATDPIATGVVAVVTLPLGAHEITLLVNDGLATATAAVTVRVITPVQAVNDLIALVNQSSLRHQQNLLGTLYAVRAALDRGQPTPACNQLLAFEGKVRIQVHPLDPSLATQLLDGAQRIIDAVCADSRAAGRFIRIERTAQGPVKLQFMSPSARVRIVEASTNLVDWETIGIAIPRGNDVFEFEDNAAGQFDLRYYRVVMP